MTPTAHEAGKVSDERLAKLLARVSPPHEGWQAGLPTMDVHAIITELRTRRAESQTGAVRVKALEWVAIEEGQRAITVCGMYAISPKGTKLTLTGIPGNNFGKFTNIEEAKAAAQADYEQRISSALEPTPIKETAEREHIATDVYSETANAEHVHAVPADVQGEPGVVAWLTTDKHGAESATIYPITDGDRSLGWRDEALIRLSDYQRLAVENERLRKERDVALDLNKRSRKHMAWAKEFVRAEAAEGKLAEAVKELEWYGEQTRLCRLIHREGDAGRDALASDGGKRARTFLASLTTPPTEQGET